MNEDGFVLGMDIGGTNVRSGFVNRRCELTNFRIKKTSEIFADSSSSGAAILLNYIELLIKESDKQPCLISLGVPSTVHRNNRFVYKTPNIKGLDNIDLASLVEDRFRIPALVSRDVCLLLLYDIHNLKLKKEGFIIGFYVGTGTASAISLNGEIITGKNGVTAELGHIPVLGRDDICVCGNRGCIEVYTCGRYLSRLRDEQFPGESISGLFTKYASSPAIETFVDNMAAAVATEINILDPEVIILGGGVIQNPDFPKKKLEAAIKKYARKPYPADNLDLVYSRESDENGVIGAMIFGFQKNNIVLIDSV